ncbi:MULTISPECIES: SO_0444 family Cu/Zn efflux transporter [unclassified Thioalkalivibrio]|uniref:SO_0444 family Cu/Zn efflux transporter n=1 Tax=unclassified Thioalkalivibrio TaxID=2621013 RepID=UPI0003814CA0|nr:MULTISPECIES: SO_0444 family Cu/Zn efflux transporter [unclassified Thioalkalivibrio]
MIVDILRETLGVALTAAPWLLLGLLAAGAVKALIPEAALQRWLGGAGLAATARAAVVGAPLPLCSCGAIPTALALHRGGAGRGPTTAFLIGTPGVGVDSLAISYALLGPLMAVARALGAIVTAITTGLLVGRTQAMATEVPSEAEPDNCGGCCGTDDEDTKPIAPERLPVRLRAGLHYAFHDVLDDIRLWLVLGLLVAGVLLALVPPATLAAWGSGLPAMLVMAVIGIPMYLCATAATPIAVGLIAAGVSPGTVLVFLLAAPITSLATLGVFRRELGTPALVLYLAGIGVTTIALGLALDAGLARTGVDVATQMGSAGELLPAWLEWTALIALVVLATPVTRRRLERLIPNPHARSA